MKKWLLFFSLSIWFSAQILYAQVLYVAAAGSLHNENGAEYFRTGITFFTSLFVENLPAESLSVYNAPGSAWTGEDILTADHPLETLKAAIAACPAQEDDGILIFWMGRGGIVKDEFLFFVNEPLTEYESPTEYEFPTEPAPEASAGEAIPDEDAVRDTAEAGGGETDDSGQQDIGSENPEPEEGRGADEEKAAGFHEKRIPRSELVLALKEKKVRFAGLITDSCPRFKRGTSNKKIRYTPNTEEITSLMSSLFFEARGFLDVNSCRRNQTSLLTGTYGSLMIAALGEFLETSDEQAAYWTEAAGAVNAIMRDRARTHKQKLDLFSVPKEPRRYPPPPGPPGPPPPGPPGPPPPGHHHRSARQWRDDWDQIAREIRIRLEQGGDELYPSDYQDAPSRFRSSLWSAPRYYPERGDLLIGINGRRILNYDQYLDAIQSSPDLIYLTVIDHRTGFVYEMRTMMGPPGLPVRLGLAVIQDPWGGVRVTETILGSPAAHCQYLIGYKHWRYDPFLRRE